MANSNMLYKILRESGELLWQPNLGKISQNCTDFSSLQDIGGFFACIVGFSGSVTSNMLSRISRKPSQSPWQPNLDKITPKLHKYLFLARNRGIFHTYSKVYGVVELKYAT